VRTFTPEHRAKLSAAKKLDWEKNREIHLANLKAARDARTPEQLELAADGLRRWNDSPEGQAQRRANLDWIREEWLYSPENRDNLARIHDSWLKSPEGVAQYTANYSGLQSFVKVLRARDGDLCQICLDPMNFRIRKSSLSLSVDHIIPCRAGGTDDLNNLWLAHLVCNMRKGARHAGRPDGSTDPR
jgi:5-methylcytosine-specific restriction endonuclease McrA